jgi:hypothetical protein
MAKALKYFFEFSDIDADDYKVEIWVEGFAGTATELIAGGNPLTRTYNKDVGEKYLGGIVPSVISIEAISNASFHAVDFTGQNYGDAVAVVYKNTVLQYNAIIVPFEGSDSDLNDGIYSVNLSAECGLVNLKTITFLPTGTRKKLLDVIIECINNIPYVNSFGYSVVDNVDLRDADLNKPYYYESFIEDKFFEGLSCYDVINSIIQQYGQFTFTDGRWDIKNIAEISKVNSVKRTYSNAGVLQSSTTYTRPDESVTRIAGGDFGLMFSQKSVTIEKTKSISRSLNPNSGFDNPTGWTFEGLAPLLFEITNGYLTNKGNTWFTEPSNLPDSSYVQSPPTTYFPFKSSFELTPKQEIKIKFKSTKGSFIKNLRLQIIAVQDLDVNFYYLTNEGSWYRALAGVNTPIYAADFKDNVEEVITVPQVPFLLPDTPPVLSNVIPVYGEFMPYPYLNAVSDLPYKIYVRVFMPERLGDDFPTGATALDLTTQIDYIDITAEEINNNSLNGFTKKFGVSTQKDRSGDLTIKLGVGYPSFPVAYDSLFFNGSTTKPITLYNSLPIEEFIADSYLSVLSQRQKFYQGTVIANIEFGDLLDIDGEKHRIHNYEYNYKLKQANIKTIGLGVNADTIEELPVYDSDVNLDIDSILNQVDIDMNRKYGDNLNLKFVDKNIQINTLADGQKSLSLRQDFRISRLYSTDVFLRTASDGSIQDVAEDTEGNFTLIKPAKDGTYALLEDIEDLAWLQEGNTATVATKKLGTLDNFDFNIIRNNVNIGQIKSTGLDLLDNRLDVGAVQYNVATAQTVGVAKTIWNDTFGTLEFGLKGGNINYRLGQSSIVYVKSADNAGLTKGTVVYTAGSDGINKTVRLAQANAESTSSKTFGIIAETVTGGEKAFCTTFGNLEGINTSAFAEGATIYLSPTVAGGMTTTKPSAPNHVVVVGFCLRSHATQGVIFVKVQNGFELDEIHDVAIGTLANNNLLAYEAGTSLWKNKTFAELGIVSGTGTTNFVTKWSNATGGLTNSQIFDNGVNVGIGTIAPTAKLHIKGDSFGYTATGTSSVRSVLISNINDAYGLHIGASGDGNSWLQAGRADNTTKYNLILQHEGGNVGIGTTNPSDKLSLIHNSSIGLNASVPTDVSRLNWRYQGLVYSWIERVHSDGAMAFGVQSAERMRIASNGNVGIGTPNPSATLHVVRNGAETLRLQRSSGTNFRIATYLDAVGTQMYSTTSADNAYNPIRINGSYIALNSDTGGNVGIGTASTSQLLHLRKDSASEVSASSIQSSTLAGMLISNLNVSANIGASIAFQLGGTGTAWASIAAIRPNANNSHLSFYTELDDVFSEKVRILNNGNVGINTIDPTQKLDVNGTSRTTNLMITNGAAVGKVWQCNNANGAGEWVTPLASERYIGEWAANSGVAPSASPTTGDYYVVNTAGTYLGITYAAGDEIYWNGTAWLKRSNFLTLPIATASVLGGIKIGTGLSIDGSGVVSVASSPILTTARTISATGDGTWSVSFNGSADVSGALALATIADSGVGSFLKITRNTKGLVTGTQAVVQADIVGLLGAASITNAMLTDSGATAGTYRSVTVNAKGLVTAGTNPTTLAGYGITDVYTKTESDNTFHKTADTTAATLEIPYVNVLSATRKQLVTSGIKIKLEAAFGDGTLAQNLGLEVQGRINIVYDSNNAVYLGKDAGKLDINTNSRNTIVGHFGLDASETTNTNAGLGYEVLSNLISGSGNVALGAFAGRNADRTLPLTISTDGIFIGRNSRPLADSSLNEIVIGANLRGKGNNTVAIGDSSITYNYFNGNLDYTGLLSISGVTGTSGQFLKRGASNNVWASIGHADISDLSTFTGFDTRYFTETESDARFVALAGSYVNPTWISSLAWTKITGVPTTFAPSAHTHAAADIVSGVIATARLAESGTASATTFLRGDQTWATLPAPTLTSTRIGFGSGSNLLTSSANFVFEDDRVIAIKEGTTSKMEVARYVGSSNYGLYVTGGNLELQSLTGGTVISKSNHNFQGSILLNNLPGTAGQVLTSQGSGANPTWTTVSGGTQDLDDVLGVGNTAINKQIILNGTNSVLDSAAIMFYRNGVEKGKLYYDNQFLTLDRLRLTSTSKIQILSEDSVGLYGTSTIIGSLSGTGTRMVVADASGVLSTQAIPSGGIGTIDQVLAAGNTSINKSFNMQNGGLFFNSQNGSLVGGISGSSFLDGSPASLSISTATNIMMQITAGSFNVISENVIIGNPNTTGLINLQGTPFNFNENAQNLGMGENGNQWGWNFIQSSPQPGDRIIFFWDGTRFVMSHVHTYTSGGKTYLTID